MPMGVLVRRRVAIAGLMILTCGCAAAHVFEKGPLARLSFSSPTPHFATPLERVAEKLRLHGELEDSRLTVAGREGRIVLYGVTPTKVERSLALRLAKDTEGVSQVVSKVKVDPLAPPHPLSPSTLPRERNILSMLMLSKSVSSIEDLEVETRDSMIVLKGAAPTAYIRDKAFHLARSCVRGTTVINQITLKPIAP